MNKLSKAMVGTAAAAAMAVSAAPAMAKQRDNNKISAGEVIAGAVILGGIAAVLASGNKRDRDYDYRGGDHYRGGHGDYRRGNHSQRAVNQCIRATESRGNGYTNIQVTQVKDVDRTRYGYKVKGKLAATTSYRGHGRYDRGYNRNHNSNYDTGKFTCYVEGGRVADINISGIRGY